jgi:hypothetical protein
MRLLGALALAGLIGLMADDLAVADTKKASGKYAAKKAAPLPGGLLAEDAKIDAAALARHIDKLIAQKIGEEKTVSSPRCSDEEFLRRVYLDITGKIPTYEQAVAFLDSKDQNRRAKLIDELLESKEYGRHMADIWQALLLPRNSDNRRLMQWYPHLVKWLDEQFNANAGWDKIARGIVTASGEVNKTGPAVYWVANATADKVTDNVTRMFLGVQLQCAQCHNHPFTDFKQDEYWGMAAFFIKTGPNGNPRGAANKGGTVSIVERPNLPPNRRRMLPESAKFLPPKFLQGEKPTVKSSDPVRPVLADWMTSPKNPFFARAMVNRMWSQFFGRGIVNPVDDMIDANAPSHPELLADLSAQFAKNGFDLKYLVRAICNSETYQRSSKPHGNNGESGSELFARMAVKVVTPQQLYDSLGMLTGPAGRGRAGRPAPANRNAPNAREAFVNFFSAEDGADPTEYQDGIPQVLRLMNAPQLNNFAVLQPTIRAGKSPDEIVERLYLTVLARRPSEADKGIVKKFLDRNKGDAREAYAGVLWALMNSSEFRLIR